jgi:hypothetical protein
MAPTTRTPRGRVALRRRPVDQHIDHARHGHQPADALGGDGRAQAVDVQPVLHHDLAADHQRGQAEVGGCHVEQRRPGDVAVFRPDAVLRRKAHRARHHRALADHGALRQAGGPAGVEDDQALLGVDVDARIVFQHAGQEGVELRFDQDDLRHAVPDARQRRCVPCRDEDHDRRDQAQAVRELGIGQAPVQAGHDDTDLRRRELQLQVLAAVLRQHRNPIPGAQTAHEHGLRQTAGRSIELAVAQHPARILQRHGMRSRAGLLAQQVRHRQRIRGSLGVRHLGHL